MRIRPFTDRDITRMVELANEYAFFDGPTTEADFAAAQSYPSGLLVAEEGNEIVGFAYGHFKNVPAAILANWGVTTVAYVELLVVNPSQRGKGIGRKLLERLLNELKKGGADLVLLDCPVEAREAKNLYEKCDFEVRAYHMKKRM